MKKSLFLLIVAVILTGFVYPAFGSAETPNYIRLHVIANSDSEWDQAVKLKVRDVIRELAAERLGRCENAEQAFETLEKQRDDFQKAAAARARECGFYEKVSIETGTFSFPDRVYGEEMVPAGEYRALRVILGDGDGKNWWCVIYPGLCLPEENDGTSQITFYSSIGRWLTRLFGGEIL